MYREGISKYLLFTHRYVVSDNKMAKEIKSLQLLAKDCMKKEKYTEAFLHLTHALK